MKLRIVTVSSRAPQWIQQGYEEYARRMPREFALDLVEVRPEPRSSTSSSAADVQRLKAAEAQRIRKHLDGFETVVALDEHGKTCSTVGLSTLLQTWQGEAKDAAFIIGGADGLAQDLMQTGHRICLSAMTLPHQLVRVLLAEQLYRAVCILNNHPYHRA